MSQIGDVARQLNISADALRYYEKIHLLLPISRDTSGLRNYSEKDVSRLKFIQRAQRMGFSLEDIGRLLEFREAPQEAKPDVRRLAGEKLAYVEEQLRELKILRDELTLLINLCATSEDGCAIIKGLEDD